MKIFFVIFALIVFSCGYPDIDSVPDFKNIKLTEEELMDLCSVETSDKNKNELCNN